ncbi:HNH endonuclease [Ancylobacter sp. FA202]|uniref:HNH endonuclease n=1 Tax=Ancylobacter sp. FA202 TaxID=1111106 RepID=UPI001FD98C54|nr:HNH endonuclease [Ancylobacter sp. FA202]
MPVRPPMFRPSHARAPRPSDAQERDRRRGSARDRGYTAEWDRAAKAYLDEHPLCLGCSAVGRLKPAALVDHVEPHRFDMVKFWVVEMWQPSCRRHHDVVKKHLEARFDRGELRVEDLRLDSRVAIAATLAMMPVE